MAIDDSLADHANLMVELHWEIQDWKSQFQAMDDDILLLEELLNSQVYESNTLNLFERLQDYKTRLQVFETKKCELRNTISRHESHLGSKDIYDSGTFQPGYYREHDKLKTGVENNQLQFQEIKLEILNYTQGLPKK